MMHSPEKQVRIAWNAFNKLDDAELYNMLIVAGLVPSKDYRTDIQRRMRLQQALIVWFKGSIPHYPTLQQKMLEL